MATNFSHLPTQMPEPEGSYALLTEDPEAAAVFVHGFRGHPRKSWFDFQGLIDELQGKFPAWGKCDLFFYSYPSHDQIKPLAENFLAFLIRLFPQYGTRGDFFGLRLPWQDFTLPSGRRIITRPIDTRQAYKRLILVGHSTGALIIREAVLQTLRPLIASLDKTTWEKYLFILNAFLRFFAPAHRGAMCAGPLGGVLHLPVSEWVLAFWLYSNPLFRNLQPGSPVLEDIRRETEELQKTFPDIPALRASSLFGAKDVIVYMGKYKNDVDCPTEPWRTHTSVCKPRRDYIKPLEFVIDAIARRATGL